MSAKGKILLLIVGSYFVDLLFTLFEFDACHVKHMHPFYYGEDLVCGHWDGQVSNSSFAYGFFAMASRAMLIYAAWLAVKYRILLPIFLVCFWIEMADSLDYYLVRNGWWTFIPKFDFFIFNDIKFEFNYVKILIITGFAAYEYTRKPS